MEKDVNSKIIEEVKEVLKNKKSSAKEDSEKIIQIVKKYSGK